MYEYVYKNEYQSIREQVEKIIHKIQQVMRRDYHTTFQYHLIGSGGRNIITRVVGGNGGYDFDYNFILQAPEFGYSYKADIVKQQFMMAAKEAVKDTIYNDPSDSTSAITIKVVDRENSRIVHSCDFAIIYYERDIEASGYKILKHFKSQNLYDFEFRPLSQMLESTIAAVCDCYQDGWNLIRDEYLKLKNNNTDTNKRSSILYLEAVNNVYNWMRQEQYDESEYDE